MKSLRSVLTGLVLATSVTVGAHADETASPDTPPAPMGRHRGLPRGEFFGPMHVLHQLNLSPEQKAQVKSILVTAHDQAKTQMASARANREALASTPPTDPNYPALVAAEKTRAANRIQQMSDLWQQVYALLTPEQKAQIPAIVAAEKQQFEARREAWQGSHPQT